MSDCREIIFMSSNKINFGSDENISKSKTCCAYFGNCIDRNKKGIEVSYFKKKFDRNHVVVILLDKHRTHDLYFICDSITHEVLHHAIYHILGDSNNGDEMSVRSMIKHCKKVWFIK